MTRLPMVTRSRSETFEWITQSLEMMYRHRYEPQQATLVIPRWAMERLDALPEDRRQAIMDEVDAIAASYGLTTPTRYVVGD